MKLKDIRTLKSGTDYLVLQVPKRIMKKLPDGHFYLDIEIKDVRGGRELTKLEKGYKEVKEKHG